jgi:hypothetical protein
VRSYRKCIGSSNITDDRILITAQFTTGEIQRACGMLICVVDDEILDDDDGDMCNEVYEHVHVTC